jgi:hypothetical protein
MFNALDCTCTEAKMDSILRKVEQAAGRDPTVARRSSSFSKAARIARKFRPVKGHAAGRRFHSVSSLANGGP